MSEAPRSLSGLWVAWVLYAGVATCGGVYGGGLVVVTAIAALWPVMVVVVSRTMRVVQGRRGFGDGEVPGESEPWPLAWPLFVLAVVLGMWPAAFAMGRPDAYIYYPVPQLLFGAVLGLLPFLVLQAACWRRASAAARRAWWVATLAVLTTHAAWLSTFGLQVLFALHSPLFEAARLEAIQREGPGVEGWEEDVRIGLFTFDAVGQTGNFVDPPPIYFAAEQCWAGHDYERGDQWRTKPYMCFKGAGGSGFYYRDESAPHPRLNQSADGRLVGGWWWYVDD